MLIKDLNKYERPSLMNYIDQFIREDQGAIYSSYNEEDLTRLVERLKRHYTINISSYPTITESFKEEDFIIDVKNRVIQTLNNRPTQELVDEYERLCKKYGLTIKKTAINKSNTEARINKMIATNGASQDR